MDRKLVRLMIGLCLFAPTLLVACGDDDGDDHGHPAEEEPKDAGGAGTGATMDSGTPRPDSGPVAGTGGGNDAGPTADASADAGNDASMPSDCDLSGEDKDRETIPAATGTMTLTSDKVWVLDGLTYVADGETLTIEPCTRIEGVSGTPPSTLIVSRGATIMAEGTADEPILFTSEVPEGGRAAGDWGGVMLLGKASNFNGEEVLIEGLADAEENHHGGTADDDSSGVLTYIRIEFGGYELSANNEINGLTMGSVGSGTVIDHIMVNTTLDDCFEWFGGTVNADHLVCNNGGDDMFDADQGYTGTLEFLFGRAQESSSSDPNGFEMDSSLSNLEPVTEVTASNVTMCGVGQTGAAKSRGVVLRENVTGEFDNIVVTGFDVGVDARDTFGTPADPSVTIANSLFFDQNTADLEDPTDDDGGATPGDMGFDEDDWFSMGDNNEIPDPAPFTVDDCQAEDGPNATVTGSDVGAFTGEADWITGNWVNWDIE